MSEYNPLQTELVQIQIATIAATKFDCFNKDKRKSEIYNKRNELIRKLGGEAGHKEGLAEPEAKKDKARINSY